MAEESPPSVCSVYSHQSIALAVSTRPVSSALQLGKTLEGDGWVEVFGHGVFWTHVALKVQSRPEALRVCGEADDTKTVAT